MSRSGAAWIDDAAPGGARALERLDSERVGWLTTVDSHGTPQVSPVWFVWTGESVVVYSLDSHRVRNIVGHQPVSFNLDSNGKDGDIVIIEGEAHLDRTVPTVAGNPAYLAKYSAIIAEHGWSVEWFSSTFDVPIVVVPNRFRYW